MTRKIAIITGGSRGIGAATAILAAKAGYDICISYITNEAAANKVLKTCKSHGARAIKVQGDVAVEVDVKSLFETCDAQLGPVNLLVNNAGIVGETSRVDALPASALERIYRVNVFGSFYCAQQAVRRMSTAKGGQGGSIVNLSSIAATIGSAGEYVHYATTKGAIDSFTVGLAREVGREGIRVNSVQAGTADTDVHTIGGGNPDRPAMVAATSALGRVARPEEIAEAILWLGSDKASYTTGTVLRVGGGL
ncbi:MAG: SDR family oxidoreductase [Rhodobacteraceae bacterium]|nr:SDR family oxidoreductase [Paracoccaceae bacterium]